MKTKVAFLAAATLLMAACGSKPVNTTQDLKEVFENPGTSGVALKTAPPELQGFVHQAVTALDKNDQVTAVMALKEIRQSPNLNENQQRAIQEMMARAYVTVSERAAAGDQQAKAALMMMNMNPR